MPANFNPIYSVQPSVQGSTAIGATALAQSNGSGTLNTSLVPVFVAGVSGSYVQRIRLQPVAGVAASATAASVLRIYTANIGLGTAFTGSAFLYQEIAVGAQTADQTTTGTAFIEVPLNFALPSGSAILVSSHVINTANTAWAGTVFGGHYA